MAKNIPVNKEQAKLYASRIRTVFSENRISGASLLNFSHAPRYLAYGVRLKQSTDFDSAIKIGEKIALKSAVDRVRVEREKGIIYYQVSLNKWQTIYTSDLDELNHIGLGLNSKAIGFNFDQPHTLVAGVTGSGKSEAVNTIVYSLAVSHTPEQLKFLMIDPHNELSEFDNVAHLLMPIAHTDDEIKGVLEKIGQVFIERKEKNIRDDYRLILVIDETNSIIRNPVYDTRILEVIATESRKFNINLLICASDTRKDALGNLPRSLSNKFIGYVPNARESAYITGYPAMQAHYLTGKGDFLHIAPGLADRFQVALTNKFAIEKLERCEVAKIEQAKVIEPTINYDLILNDQKITGRQKEIRVLPEALLCYLATNNQVTAKKAESIFSRLVQSILGEDRTFGRNWHDYHKGIVDGLLKEADKNNLVISVNRKRKTT